MISSFSTATQIDSDTQGTVTWESPSNIALIKYWGKRPVQLPTNASLSFTLSKAKTTTQIDYRYRPASAQDPWITFTFEGEKNEAFAKRISSYIDTLTEHMPFLRKLTFTISSSNSFPHSAGIASSASSMSALALGLCDIAYQVTGQEIDAQTFYQQASYVARLGSGSAARSVYGPMAIWGHNDLDSDASDEYAAPFGKNMSYLHDWHDDILIISSAQKSVSSSVGHQLMEDNPYAPARYQQAERHLHELVDAMQQQDIERMGKIIEDEALALHALMMCSNPSFILMHPNTLRAIEIIRTYRSDHQIPVFFTLDAGPNVHLLYSHQYADQINEGLIPQLLSCTEGGLIIRDGVGEGPKKIV